VVLKCILVQKVGFVKYKSAVGHFVAAQWTVGVINEKYTQLAFCLIKRSDISA
jgi:hypothetical protein